MEGVPIHEIDPNFEPQPRARSNTWPVRPREVDAESEGARTPNSVHSENDKQETDHKPEGKVDQLALSQKKGGSRRNAWGNLSYADLITKAIQSSPEGRLTLSQIYDWMVQNVPYFRDKGDSNSSAGWKNSIRHNLSLHSRFMRVQNEGTGKSSWWVLNPEAKPGKSPRRRATSMDTKDFVKKRGRVKRKVEQMRLEAAQQAGNFGSAQELNFGEFTLSPQDYRQRTASNASSIGPPVGGRLTPIEGVYDDFDDQIPGGLSPVWNQNLTGPMGGPGDHGFNDISESLAGMLVGDGTYRDPSLQEGMVSSTMANASPLGQQVSPSGYPDSSYLQQLGGGYSGGGGDTMRQISPQQLSPQNVVPPQCNRTSPVNTMPPTSMGVVKSPNGYHPGTAGGPVLNNMNNMMRPSQPPPPTRRFPMQHQSLTELLEQPDEPMDQNPVIGNGGVSSTSTGPPQSRPSMSPFTNNSALNNGGGGMNTAAGNRNNMLLGGLDMSNLTTQQRNQLTTSLLRQVLTESTTPGSDGTNAPGNANTAAPQQQNKQAFMQPNGLTAGQTNTILLSGGSMQSQAVPMSGTGYPQERSNSGLEFIDIPTDFLSECPDVDQVLSHELSLDPSLDFNFDGSSQQQQQQQQLQQQMGSSNNADVNQSVVFNGALPKLASL